MKRLWLVCLARLVASVSLMGWTAQAETHKPSMGSANYRMDWSYVGEIGGGASASAGYKLNGTLGQMAANSERASPSYKLCTGFECAPPLFQTYLPVVLK